jgi:rod shape determining protein RodA
MAMLVAVDAGGTRAYGAQRWLVIGNLVLQPSELAKLSLLLALPSLDYDYGHGSLAARHGEGQAVGGRR